MSLVEDFIRLMGQSLSQRDAELLEPLTQFCVTALDAGYELGTDLSRASRLELVARAAAFNRRETDRIIREGSAASGPVGMATVLERVDGGRAGAELVARAGLEIARQRHG